jgi:hypothetical protein
VIAGRDADIVDFEDWNAHDACDGLGRQHHGERQVTC